RRYPDDSTWLDRGFERRIGAASGNLRQKGQTQFRWPRHEFHDFCRLHWGRRLRYIRLDSRLRREACESGPAFPKSNHPRGSLSPCCSCRLLFRRRLEQLDVLAIAFFLEFVQRNETK